MSLKWRTMHWLLWSIVFFFNSIGCFIVIAMSIASGIFWANLIQLIQKTNWKNDDLMHFFMCVIWTAFTTAASYHLVREFTQNDLKTRN